MPVEGKIHFVTGEEERREEVEWKYLERGEKENKSRKERREGGLSWAVKDI